MEIRGEQFSDFTFRVHVQNTRNEQYLVAQSAEDGATEADGSFVVFGPDGNGHNTAEYQRFSHQLAAFEMAAALAVGRAIYLCGQTPAGRTGEREVGR